jgi:hypothetical protein
MTGDFSLKTISGFCRRLHRVVVHRRPRHGLQFQLLQNSVIAEGDLSPDNRTSSRTPPP